MTFKSRSNGKIAKVEGRITELCLSATVCCFLPVRSKPLFTYKRIVCLLIISYDCFFFFALFVCFLFAVCSFLFVLFFFFCLVFLIIYFEVSLSPNKRSSVKSF